MFQDNSESPKTSRVAPYQHRRSLKPSVPKPDRIPHLPPGGWDWEGLLIPSIFDSQRGVKLPTGLSILPNIPGQKMQPAAAVPKQEQPPAEAPIKYFRLAEEGHGNKMNLSFDYFRKNNLLLDLNIIVQGTNFFGHKMMMCAASPYFKKQILSIRLPPNHGSMDQNFVCFVIDKCTAKQFDYLMEYIYTGEANVPEKELAGVLKAAEDLQIMGLYSGVTTNGIGNHKTDGSAIPERMRNGHGPLNKDQETTDVKSNGNSSNGSPVTNSAFAAQANTSRPSSGGSPSSGSSKTGSSRKKGQPKKLILHRSTTPPESQSPSPESVYAVSNESPRDENRRPTPSSSRSSHDGPESQMPMAMDFSKPRDQNDDSDERPLVINEVTEPVNKKGRIEPPHMPLMPALSQAPMPVTTAAATMLQNAMKQNMSWMSGMNGVNNPFSMMHAAAVSLGGGDPNRTSSESSGVDHDSEREDQPKTVPRLPHPALPGMNPQDMIQKLQQAFMNNVAAGPGAPGGFNPYMMGLPATSASGFGASPMAGPPMGISGMSPPRDNRSSPNTNGPNSGTRGLPAGLGPNGKPAVSCEICGKTLADPSSLYRHRKIHNGEKPHKCPIPSCGRRFIQRYNMTQHIKTHFKPRGINSLANNPATLANFLVSNKATLSHYQIPEDMINNMENGQGFEPSDQDTNRYDEENTPNQSMSADEGMKHHEDSQEEIDPC